MRSSSIQAYYKFYYLIQFIIISSRFYLPSPTKYIAQLEVIPYFTKVMEELVVKLQQKQRIQKNHEQKKFKLLTQKAQTPEHCTKYDNLHEDNLDNPKKDKQIDLQWTISQLKLLQKLYEERGPSWGFISSHFKTRYVNIHRLRTQTSIKNKFRNGLTRAAKILYDFEANVNKNKSRNITSSLLFTMINFANKIQKIMNHLQLPLNFDSMIFQFRNKILMLIFRNHNFEHDDLIDLIRLIKTINSKIRCFGAFKGNQRRWKLTEQKLKSICQFDCIIKIKQEEGIKAEEADETKYKQRELENIFLKIHQNSNKLVKFFQPMEDNNEDIWQEYQPKKQQ